MPTRDDILAEITRTLEASEDLEQVLLRILEHLGLESGTIHFLGDGGQLQLAAHGPGMPPPVLEKIRAIPIGKGMAGLAFERREPVSTCNLQTDASGDVRPGARQTGLAGSICVPIWGSAGPIGTLGVGGREERTFSEQETELLIAIGRAIASRRGE